MPRIASPKLALQIQENACAKSVRRPFNNELMQCHRLDVSPSGVPNAIKHFAVRDSSRLTWHAILRLPDLSNSNSAKNGLLAIRDAKYLREPGIQQRLQIRTANDNFTVLRFLNLLRRASEGAHRQCRILEKLRQRPPIGKKSHISRMLDDLVRDMHDAYFTPLCQ